VTIIIEYCHRERKSSGTAYIPERAQRVGDSSFWTHDGEHPSEISIPIITYFGVGLISVSSPAVDALECETEEPPNR